MPLATGAVCVKKHGRRCLSTDGISSEAIDAVQSDLFVTDLWLDTNGGGNAAVVADHMINAVPFPYAPYAVHYLAVSGVSAADTAALREKLDMSKTAVIDIDNTLWQFCDALHDELRQTRPAIPPVDRWTTWDFFTPYCSKEQFMDAVDEVHARQDSDAYRPYPEANGFLRALRESGFRVVIASHRRSEMRGATGRWLEKHGLVHDELHLSFDKSVLFADASVVVDDAPHTLEQAVASNALGTGLLFPWNRACAGNGFALFRDLNEVMKHIRARS